MAVAPLLFFNVDSENPSMTLHFPEGLQRVLLELAQGCRNVHSVNFWSTELRAQWLGLFENLQTLFPDFDVPTTHMALHLGHTILHHLPVGCSVEDFERESGKVCFFFLFNRKLYQAFFTFY